MKSNVKKFKPCRDGYFYINDFDSSFREKKDYGTINKQLLYLYKQENNLDARDKLIMNNINLVRKVAKMYSGKSTMDYEDLVQEGIIGLMKGIEKFDIKKEVSFSTYTYYWIRQSIDRAVSIKGYLIRIPVHLIQNINRLNRIEKKESAIYGEIDIQKVCSIMNITEKTYHELKEYINNYQKYSSLNKFIDMEDCGEEIMDFITEDNKVYFEKDNEGYDVENNFYKKLLKEDIDKTLATLLPREEKIIRMRYGLDDGKFRSLDEVGKQFHLTRERIRQIEAKAFRKMNHYSRAKILKIYCS